jgi:hypothetical protein
MPRHTPWIIVLALLLCIAALVPGYLDRGARIQVLELRVEKLTREASESAKREKAQLTDVRQGQRNGDQANGSAGPAPTGAPARNLSSAQPHVISVDDMRKDPDGAALWRKHERRHIQRLYGETLAAMNLPPGELAKLRDLLVDRDAARMDAVDAAHQAGLSESETRIASAQAISDVDGEIRALIGDANLKALQGPQAAQYKTMIEDSIGIDLTIEGSPLTTTQSAQLARLWTDGISRNMPNAWVPDPSTGLTPLFQSILDHAATILAPEQVPVLKAYLLEQVQMNQYLKKVRAAKGGS